MLSGLRKAIRRNGFDRKRAENLLNDILYGQMMGGSHVVWYGNNREDYIKKGYMANAQVYSIIRKIADKEKMAELMVYREIADKKSVRKYKTLRYSDDLIHKALSNVYRTKALEYDENNDLAKLLKNPNPYQSQDEFLDLTSVFYRATGEFFWYRVTPIDSDKALELHIAPSHLMEIVFSDDPDNPIKGWKLSIGNGNFRELDAKDVLHMKMPNPNYDNHGSQLRGMSPLMAGGKYLKQNDAGLEAFVKALENEGAKGIVSPNHADPKLWLNPEQRKETQGMIEDKIHGTRNLHKVVVSGMPLQYTHIGLSPQALAIMDGLNFSDVKLCNLWGVQPVLFDPKPTYENQKEARKSLVTDVVIPYQNTLEQKLNAWLVPPFSEQDGVTYHLDFDTTIYSELQPDLKLMKEVYGDNRAVTMNEYREMLNLEARDEDVANELLIPAGLVLGSDYLDYDGTADA